MYEEKVKMRVRELQTKSELTAGEKAALTRLKRQTEITEGSKVEEIKGGTTSDNATMLRDILEGKKGSRRDVVLLNAAAGLVAGDLVGNLREGVELAEESIDSGRALQKLQKFIQVSQRFS